MEEIRGAQIIVRLLAFGILLVVTPIAFADGYITAGWDFHNPSLDVSAGYHTSVGTYVGAEFSWITENPRLVDDHRNQFFNFDVIGSLSVNNSVAVFAKAGPSHFRYQEAKAQLVNGANLGVGIDYRLSGTWAIRSALIYARSQDNPPNHSVNERLVSLGLKYMF